MNLLFLSIILNIKVATAAHKKSTPYVFDYDAYRIASQSLRNVTPKRGDTEGNSSVNQEDLSKIFPIIIASSSGKKRTVNVHQQITYQALGGLVKESCLSKIVEANTQQDNGDAFKDGRNHFDDNKICPSAEQIEVHIVQIKSNNSDLDEKIKHFGAVLHAIQDFYSHSNYAEIFSNIVKGKTSADIETINFGMVCNGDTLKPSKEQPKEFRELFTAWYYGHGATNEREGLFNELPHAKSHLYWNKDLPPEKNTYDFYAAFLTSQSSFKVPTGWHQNLFDIAFDLQVRHSKQYFNRVKEYFINKDC